MRRLWVLAAFSVFLLVCFICPSVQAESGSGINWVQYLTPQSLIDVGDTHTVAIQNNGVVIAAGNNEFGQCEVGGVTWEGVIAVSAGYECTMGLKKDGTVVFAGDASYGKGNVNDWTDIVAISAGGNHSVGLRVDGTVVAVGRNDYGQCDVGDWRNIVAISAGDGYTLGLHKDGSMVAAGSDAYLRGTGRLDFSQWFPMRCVAAGSFFSVGVKEDGTAVIAGHNNLGEGFLVSDWTDITAVASGSGYVLGLRKNGTVVDAGRNFFFADDITAWSNIVAIAADGNGNHSVGLKGDGTVVSAGNNDSGQRDLNDFYDLMTQPQLPDCAQVSVRSYVGNQSGAQIDQAATLADLYGTWTGQYMFTDAINLDQAGLSAERLEEMRQALAQLRDIELAFDDSGLTITAENVQGETSELGTLPNLTVDGASFTAVMNDGSGQLDVRGTLTKDVMQWKIDGEYRMTAPVSEDVTVTFVATFVVFKEL